MFEKNSKPIPGPGTVVGANVKLTGTIKDVSDIIIHGTVEGNVISEKNVLVAENAKVKGPIKALTINVSGEVDGEVSAEEKLEIQPSGKITGSISAKDLSIKSGAYFNGKCSMVASSPSEKTNKERNQPTSPDPEPILTSSKPKNEDIEFEME